jgi:hypothetical protein
MRFQLLGFPEVRGKVISQDGSPLKGVIVRSSSNGAGKTDGSGQFILEQPRGLVRFSMPGYRPATKREETFQVNSTLVLQADPKGQWDPPQCPVSPSGLVMQGDRMQFPLGETIQARRVQDDDCQYYVVCIGKYCMRHGFGPLWSLGMPTWKDFPDGFLDIQERDVRWRPDLDLQGNEYRSTHADGTYSRYLGIFGESVSYNHVTKDAAEEFDKIIDSLCWRSQ